MVEFPGLLKRHAQDLADDICEALWHEPELAPALRLAPKGVATGIVRNCISADPERAMLAFSSWVSEMAWEETELLALWDRLPDSRGFIKELVEARLPQKEMDVVRWAELYLEEGYAADAFWEEISNRSKDKIFFAPALPENWVGLSSVPARIRENIARSRKPELDAALIELSALDSSKVTRFSVADAIENLDVQDCELAHAWMPRRAEDSEALFGLMLSARAAEKCAGAYFVRLGLSVHDIAVHQITGESSEWKRMDLKVSDRHAVDVKNVRRSLGGDLLSSKWRVKRFKQDASGSDVLLCGVSSPYLPMRSGKLASDKHEDVVVLGVTTSGEVRRLFNQFAGMHVVRLNSVEKLMELPVWAWDYPFLHYAKRNEVLLALRRELESDRKSATADIVRKMIPPVLYSFWGLEHPFERNRLSRQQVEMLQLLRDYHLAQNESGGCIPRLPWLYLFILHFWMKWRYENELAETSKLLELFEWRMPGDNQAIGGIACGAAVGVVDPARSIGTLIRSLSQLEDRLPRREFISISNLTLHTNGVLAGIFQDHKRRTLLAHCGGRRTDKNDAECGFRPLVYGVHITCDCGRLICPKCHCCCDYRHVTCEAQADRLAALDAGRWRRH